MYAQFQDEYFKHEMARQHAEDSRVEFEHMSDYLVTRENHEVNNVQVWSRVGPLPSQAEVDRVAKEHFEKLERYRRQKYWEAWVEEDELDLEGERILNEIQNYKSEFFFNHLA